METDSGLVIGKFVLFYYLIFHKEQRSFPPLSHKTANGHSFLTPTPLLKMATPKWENFPTF